MIKVICYVEFDELRYKTVHFCASCPHHRHVARDMYYVSELCENSGLSVAVGEDEFLFADCPFPSLVDLVFEAAKSGVLS